MSPMSMYAVEKWVGIFEKLRLVGIVKSRRRNGGHKEKKRDDCVPARVGAVEEKTIMDTP